MNQKQAHGTKLTKEEILSLQEHDPAFYYVKLHRIAENIDGARTVWEGPTRLYIQRSVATRKSPSQLAVITPVAYDWAEGSHHCVESSGDAIVENYWMEVFHLTTNG